MSALHARPRRHASKSREHGVLVAFVALAMAAVAFVPTLYYFIGTAALAQIHTEDPILLLPPDEDRPPAAPVDPAGGQAVNILLLGSDTRVGENANIGGANGDETDMRNDTTLVMHISADRTRIEFLSFPRDAMVRISRCTTSDGVEHPGWFGMFNQAFSSGGRYGSAGDAAACVWRTIEDTTGIRIDEYAVIDFNGFQNVIDAMDGVPMCIPGHIVAAKAQLDLQPGPQILNGQQALAWARLRTAEVGQEWMGINGSDLSRIDRQHQLLSKVAEKALSTGILLNPGKFATVVQAGAGSLTTSPNLADFNWLMGLVWSVRHIDTSQVVFATVPVRGYPADPNRLEWKSSADAIFEAIAADTPISGISVADESDAIPVPSPSGTTGTDGGETTTTDDLALVGACPAGS
jgi:LCP family protein required for cell wall assembly